MMICSSHHLLVPRRPGHDLILLTLDPLHDGIPKRLSRRPITSGDTDSSHSKAHGSQASVLEPFDATLLLEQPQVVQRLALPDLQVTIRVVVCTDVDLDMLQALEQIGGGLGQFECSMALQVQVADGSCLHGDQMGQERYHAPVNLIVDHDEFEGRLCKRLEGGLVVHLPTDLQHLYWHVVVIVSQARPC
jgi:hypothetical protein